MGFFFGIELVVDASCVDFRALGDLSEGRCEVSLLAEQFGGRIQNSLPGDFRLRGRWLFSCGLDVLILSLITGLSQL